MKRSQQRMHRVVMAMVVGGVCISSAPAAPKKEQPDNTLTKREAKQGWVLLFDGTLHGWMTNEKKPSARPVEQGAINPHKSGGYMVVHEKEWDNFELAVDFKISKGCNSGVFLRTNPLVADSQVGWNGIEIQVLDSKKADYHDTGAIYDLIKPVKNAMKPAGEWNHMVIRCVGNLVDVQLNGEKVNHMDLDQWAEKGKRPDGSAHKFKNTAWKNHPRRGFIGFQDHGSDCWFKNVKLLPIKAGAESKPSP